MKRNQLRFVGSYLTVSLLVVSAIVVAGCTCSPKSQTTTTGSIPISTAVTSTSTSTLTFSTTTTTSTPQLITKTTATVSTPLSTITKVASFPYQGSGTGVWSGTIIYNSKNYSVGGDLTLAIDANGVVSGSMNDTSGNSITVTEKTLQVDPNGNITGSSSFGVRGVTFTFTWQGKVTRSGNTLSVQGTWTGQYGNGTFSGTGTSSN
jgi:hypothetical protein